MLTTTIGFRESLERNGPSIILAATFTGGIYRPYHLDSIRGEPIRGVPKAKRSRNSFKVGTSTLYSTNERCSLNTGNIAGNSMRDGATHMEVLLELKSKAQGDSQVTTWTDFSYNKAQRTITPPRKTVGGQFQVTTPLGRKL